ncbi:MAG: sensor histidine kinase [Roseburia sp.]
MLLILVFCLVVASVLLILYKRDRDSFLLFGLCISLLLEIGGVMIFIAKKGGISQEVVNFLYFSKHIHQKIQYFLITLNQLGYVIAVGRSLFPFFLMEIALSYSMIPILRKNKIWQWIVAVIPVTMLLVYFPSIYREIVVRSDVLQRVIANINLIWIRCYLFIAIVILIIEFFSITIRFCKRQFSQIVIFLVSISAIYILYYNQDPGQVYRFYSYSNAWNSGIGYLQIEPSVSNYAMLVIVNIICAILGFFSFFRYTRGNYEVNMQDVVMERKFDTIKVGVSMFVHSMKNQLLSSRVIYKRIDQLYNQPELDTNKLKEYVDSLRKVNDLMLTRIEELYRSVKSNSITLVPTDIQEITDTSMERFHEKYPGVEVEVQIENVSQILADKLHLCEAIYNLLVNAQEAVLLAERAEEGKIYLYCKEERLYTLIEVRDNGLGISKTQIKKIFDPFYSSKNSNSNWGMGLYYVREVVKSHYGKMRVESEAGAGSSFYILLPKYR